MKREFWLTTAPADYDWSQTTEICEFENGDYRLVAIDAHETTMGVDGRAYSVYCQIERYWSGLYGAWKYLEESGEIEPRVGDLHKVIRNAMNFYQVRA